MKRRDVNSLTLIPCPLCKLGQAVNRYDAYQVFTSKKYVKLRKAQKQANAKAQPTIGKSSNLESVLLDPASAEFFNPMIPLHKMSWVDGVLHYLWLVMLFRFLLVAGTIWLGIWFWETGLAADTKGMWLQLFVLVITVAIWGVWIWVERQVKQHEDEDAKSSLQEYYQTWVCLRCREQFLHQNLKK